MSPNLADWSHEQISKVDSVTTFRKANDAVLMESRSRLQVDLAVPGLVGRAPGGAYWCEVESIHYLFTVPHLVTETKPVRHTHRKVIALAGVLIGMNPRWTLQVPV